MPRWLALLLPLGLLAPFGVAVFLLSLSDPRQSHEQKGLLRLGVVDSPSIYQLEDDQAKGFDYELAKRYVEYQGKALRVMVYPNPEAVVQALKGGDIDIAPIGYTQPKFNSYSDDILASSAPYHKNDWIIVHKSGAPPVKSWRELAGKQVLLQPRIELHPLYQALAARESQVRFVSAKDRDEEAVIAAVSLGEVDYALVDENLFQITQHIFYDVGKSFTAINLHRAWLTSNRNRGEGYAIEQFFKQRLPKSTLAMLVEKHFAHTQKIKMFDLQTFESRITERLPAWRGLFQDVAKTYGMDWRLLAALAYQESHWNPKAVSETFVQGIMQLTEDTAKRYKVDRNDPKAAIIAGAKYLHDLHQGLPNRIPEPDRIFLALAAYNLGLGHVEDARILCKRQGRNPDSWADVKKTLPMLAVPHVAAQTKHGIARGGMPVEFVDNIRAFYELLKRHEVE